MKIKEIVIEALQARGFSQSEAEQIVRRLASIQNMQTISKNYYPYNQVVLSHTKEMI